MPKKDYDIRFRCTERMYNLLKLESSRLQVGMSELIRVLIKNYLVKKGAYRNAK